MNIYANRIEFVSIGGLVKGITVKDIMNGISQPRNSVIANVFYRLELIESYGTGIQRILESYSKCSVQPTFTPSPASFVVMLPNTKYNSDSEMTDEEKVLSLFKDTYYPAIADTRETANKKRYRKNPLKFNNSDIYIAKEFFDSERESIIEWYKKH